MPISTRSGEPARSIPILPIAAALLLAGWPMSATGQEALLPPAARAGTGEPRGGEPAVVTSTPMPAPRPEPTAVPTPAPAPAPVLRADAGDDQIGLVGRQITLNGGRSGPRGAIGYRWIQLSGPEPTARGQDGYIFTFTPRAAGIYRFALVVASGSEISEPDAVEVAVGTLSPTGPDAAPRAMTPAAPAPPIGDVARTALAGLEDGPEAAPALVSTFEAIAGRMGLYSTYAEVFSEMSRRLDAFVPQEPSRRSAWVERLFRPLTASLVEKMRGEGIDLLRPESATAPLSASQKDRLAEQFRAIAAGLRPSPTTTR